MTDRLQATGYLTGFRLQGAKAPLHSFFIVCIYSTVFSRPAPQNFRKQPWNLEGVDAYYPSNEA